MFDLTACNCKIVHIVSYDVWFIHFGQHLTIVDNAFSVFYVFHFPFARILYTYSSTMYENGARWENDGKYCISYFVQMLSQVRCNTRAANSIKVTRCTHLVPVCWANSHRGSRTTWKLDLRSRSCEDVVWWRTQNCIRAIPRGNNLKLKLLKLRPTCRRPSSVSAEM